MQNPTDEHWVVIKQILRYLKSTIYHGLLLRSSSSFILSTFSDADWAGCPNDRRSTSRYCIYHGPNLISWSLQKQHTVSRSSIESEYYGLAKCYSRSNMDSISPSWIRISPKVSSYSLVRKSWSNLSYSESSFPCMNEAKWNWISFCPRKSGDKVMQCQRISAACFLTQENPAQTPFGILTITQPRKLQIAHCLMRWKVDSKTFPMVYGLKVKPHHLIQILSWTVSHFRSYTLSCKLCLWGV